MVTNQDHKFIAWCVEQAKNKKQPLNQRNYYFWTALLIGERIPKEAYAHLIDLPASRDWEQKVDQVVDSLKPEAKPQFV